MKKLSILILFVACFQPAFSQKLEKFEDQLPRMLALPPSGALAQLKRYFQEEAQNPALYFQMAVIYETRYKNSDPIKDYAYKVGNAREAVKAFEVTNRYLDDKHVRRNEELYFNFGRIDEKGRVEVEYDTIRQHIDQMMAEMNNYIANVPTIYDKFTKSFSSYDKAHKGFTSILGDYPTFKDLYLLYDQSVDDRFEQIKSDYLESLKYWEEYKSASDTFDVGYDQNMSVRPIKVYRLDGLESKINFLKSEIAVWDYASWVDETREIIHAEIDQLRLDLAKEKLRLDREVEQAQPDFIRDEFEPLKVSKEVLFKLRKYDLNSVVEPIFIYKEKKHDLIYQQLLSRQLDTATSLDVERKLYLYGQMVNRIKEADTVLSDIRRRNTEASLNKYPEFINTHYQGMSGISSLITTERSANREDAAQYVSTIRDRLYEMLASDSTAETVTHNRKNIALQEQLSADNDMLGTDPITTHRVENFDGSLFLGGIFRNEKEDKTQAFVCGVTPDKKVGWYNEYLLQFDSAIGPDSHTRVGAIKTVPGGLAVILNGVDTNMVRHNHLYIFDEKGDVTLSRRLLLNQYPRTINYNERTNTLMVTYKGEDYLDDILQQSELILANYSIYGDLLWQQRMSYKGDINNVVNLDDGYMLLGNYNELKMLDGKISRVSGSNLDTRSFALKVDLSGEVTDMKTFNNSRPYFTNKVYKVSDDCINVFGSNGSYTRSVRVDDEPGSAVHLIINSDLEVLANSMK